MSSLSLGQKAMLVSLIEQNIPFALFRLPHEQQLHFIWQKDTKVEAFASFLDLSQKRGFLLAPFSFKKHQLILIRPDFKLTLASEQDWQNLTITLQAFLDEFALTKTCCTNNSQSISLNDQEATTLQKENSNLFTKLETEEQAFIRYTKVFERFIQPLQAHRFTKLVLARSCQYQTNTSFDIFELFNKANSCYKNMMVSLCFTPKTGVWLGSTPEILLKGSLNKNNNFYEYSTMALAGTMATQDFVDENGKILLPTLDKWSDKNKAEQAVVADYIATILKKYAQEVTVNGPFTAQAANVVHLKTEFVAKLKHEQDVLKLINDLHPTPAVCGLPKQEAFHFIEDHEDLDRSYYSGVIGYLNNSDFTKASIANEKLSPQEQQSVLDNTQNAMADCKKTIHSKELVLAQEVAHSCTLDTSLYVNLRCLSYDYFKFKIALFGGGGILSNSSAQSEFDETQQKMNTLRNLLANN